MDIICHVINDTDFKDNILFTISCNHDQYSKKSASCSAADIKDQSLLQF